MLLPSGLGVWVKIIAFTVFRKIPNAKELTFENERHFNVFLSVFSVLSYIFENN